MESQSKKNDGKKALIKKYRDFFRLPENLHYYSPEDFKEAERKFIKYALQKGEVDILSPDLFKPK